jgi:hypothetical protein
LQALSSAIQILAFFFIVDVTVIYHSSGNAADQIVKVEVKEIQQTLPIDREVI